MAIKKQITEFVRCVEPPKPIFHVEKQSDHNLRVRPSNLDLHTVNADLGDPLNHLLASSIHFWFDPSNRHYVVEERNMYRTVCDNLASRIKSAVGRLPLNKYPTLHFWCLNYIHGHTIMTHEDVVDTLIQIYRFAAVPNKDLLVDMQIADSKIDQFGLLMNAFKIKLTKDKGWNNEENPNKRHPRRRRRR